MKLGAFSLLAFLGSLSSLEALAAAEQPVASFAVAITVDAGKPLGAMKPVWRFFGADEPNYATMKDGRKLLGELGELRSGDVFFRAHNLLCTGDGTPALKWGSTNVYTEDAEGRPVYDWTIVDGIFDTYLARGVRPVVELGFMPQALSTHPEPYQHDWRPGLPYERIVTGWAYPPKDYDKWRELAYKLAEHCVQRYGRSEVETWYWEVWNEANGAYWKGTQEEWYKLHDYAVDGVRRALPTARVGGPHSAGSGGAFMDGFLKHVTGERNYATGEIGTPTDFVAFHAKGAPTVLGGQVRMGIAAHLKTIDAGFRKIAAIPALKRIPILIGESDPDGCAACQGPQLGYRSGTLYSSYVAESFARKYELADRHGVNLDGALTWAFEFEDQPYFAGQRVLATNGIDLAVLNVFRLFARMSGQRVAVRSSGEVPLDRILAEGVRKEPDVSGLASLDEKRLCVLLWHYHDDDVAGPDASVELSLRNLPWKDPVLRSVLYRIDREHANAYAEWLALGSPSAPSEAQYRSLSEAARLSALQELPAELSSASGGATVRLALPRQGVALLVLERK